MMTGPGCGLSAETSGVGAVRSRGLPPSVVRFKSEIAAADALLFVTPEHNRSIPAALKNAIDWGARPCGQNSWSGKPAAITGT